MQHLRPETGAEAGILRTLGTPLEKLTPLREHDQPRPQDPHRLIHLPHTTPPKMTRQPNDLVTHMAHFPQHTYFSELGPYQTGQPRGQFHIPDGAIPHGPMGYIVAIADECRRMGRWVYDIRTRTNGILITHCIRVGRGAMYRIEY